MARPQRVLSSAPMCPAVPASITLALFTDLLAFVVFYSLTLFTLSLWCNSFSHFHFIPLRRHPWMDFSFTGLLMGLGAIL